MQIRQLEKALILVKVEQILIGEVKASTRKTSNYNSVNLN